MQQIESQPTESKLYRGQKKKNKVKERKTRFTIRQSEKEAREENELRVLSSFVERLVFRQIRTSRASSQMGRENKSSNAVVIEDAFHLVLVVALGIINQKCAQQGMDHILMAVIVRWICFSHRV